MRNSWFHAIVLIALGAIVLFTAGCGGESGGADSNAGDAAMPSGEAFDQAFIDAMVPHHQAAIEMAKTAKKAGLSQPDLIEIADDILETQQLEIDQMKDWRGKWFSSSEIDPKGADALGLSESQMGMSHDANALMSSDDIDQDFAQMMITHHNGAIDMAKLAEDNAEHQEIKDLAAAIIEAQEREIETMRMHASGEHVMG